MGLDEIEQRCLEYGVSIALTIKDRELGKEIRILETQVKELIVKINTKFNDAGEYYEIYDLKQKIHMIDVKYKRYISDKIDPVNNDSDLQELLDFEFDSIKMELETLKEKVIEFSNVLTKVDSSTLENIEWENFLMERAKRKVANVIITNRAFSEFQKYFLDTSGSRDISMQAVEGLLKTLDALETHQNLFIEDLGSSKKLNISNKGVMEYLITKGGIGGVFRAIYFYDNNQSRIVYSLLFKSESEKTDEVGKDADKFISQAERGKNIFKTNNELFEIREAIENNDLQEYEKRVLFMYRELLQLKKRLQRESLYKIFSDKGDTDSCKSL